jgi:hypothetical protein
MYGMVCTSSVSTRLMQRLDNFELSVSVVRLRYGTVINGGSHMEIGINTCDRVNMLPAQPGDITNITQHNHPAQLPAGPYWTKSNMIYVNNKFIDLHVIHPFTTEHHRFKT